jgi:FkbM family methyltransferase
VAAPAFDAYVGEQLVRDGHWMPQEARLLTGLLQPGSVAVDAGANIGGFAMPLSERVGATGEVHAFEPFRLLYQLLTANCALNGLRSCITHHKALGSAPARKLLRMPGLNAIGNPSKMYVADSVASEMHITYDMHHQETVEVIRLDDLALPRLDLLKIDVESMEYELLLGAAETIRRCRPVMYVEDSEGELESMSQPTRVMRHLAEKHSYTCINLAQSGLPDMTSLLCAGSEQIQDVKERVFSMHGLAAS